MTGIFGGLIAGDLYSLALAEKVLEVMRRTPWCNHWLPTRMHKFEKFRASVGRDGKATERGSSSV